MPKLYNLARMTSATTGTGTLTLGVAVSGYLSFANAGAANNDIVFYGIKDGSNSEVGWGTYASAGPTITRNVVKSTNSNALISCSGSEEVYITALASDGGDLLPGFDHPMRGFDLPINLQLNASVASNILTVAVKGNNGSDPSNSNPVLVPFRDATVASGDPAWVAITSALSINTNAVGASLGSSNGTPFRLWVVLFNNGGTPILGLINCSTAAQILPLDETSVQSTTAMSATATSAGIFYTPNGTALASKAFRLIGYVEYGSGLTTAGTYASAPTKIQLFGPGVKKPGDIVQTIMNITGAFSSGTGVFSLADTIPTNTGGTQFMSQAITPTATPNLLLIETKAELQWAASTQDMFVMALFQDAITNALSATKIYNGVNANTDETPKICHMMQAGTTSATTFKVRAGGTSGTPTMDFNGRAGSRVFGGALNSYLQLTELMG